MRRETLGVKRVASKVGRILRWTSHVSCGKGGGEGSASVVGVRCAVARLVARWWEDAFSRGGFPAATNGFPRLYISRRYVQPASLTKRHHHLQLPLHLPSIQNPVSRPLLLLPPAPAPINVQTPPPPGTTCAVHDHRITCIDPRRRSSYPHVVMRVMAEPPADRGEVLSCPARGVVRTPKPRWQEAMRRFAKRSCTCREGGAEHEHVHCS